MKGVFSELSNILLEGIGMYLNVLDAQLRLVMRWQIIWPKKSN
ncbi:hypothetical protein CsSME_00048144 [Camellia sinensis var. sinensis]